MHWFSKVYTVFAAAEFIQCVSFFYCLLNSCQMKGKIKKIWNTLIISQRDWSSIFQSIVNFIWKWNQISVHQQSDRKLPSVPSEIWEEEKWWLQKYYRSRFNANIWILCAIWKINQLFPFIWSTAASSYESIWTCYLTNSNTGANKTVSLGL